MYTATWAIRDTATKKVLHIHVFKDDVEAASFEFTFTTRADLRSQIQALSNELGAALTQIRQAV